MSEKEMGELLKEQQKEALTYLRSRPSFKVNQNQKIVNEKANGEVIKELEEVRQNDNTRFKEAIDK